MSTPSRRTLLRLLPLLPFAGLFTAEEAHATHYAALLCRNCGFGNKGNNCVRCNRWVANRGVPARLCSTHGFGAKGNNCVRCNRWVGNNRQVAYLCGNCGFGNKKTNCAICGRWAP